MRTSWRCCGGGRGPAGALLASRRGVGTLSFLRPPAGLRGGVHQWGLPTELRLSTGVVNARVIACEGRSESVRGAPKKNVWNTDRQRDDHCIGAATPVSRSQTSCSQNHWVEKFEGLPLFGGKSSPFKIRTGSSRTPEFPRSHYVNWACGVLAWKAERQELERGRGWGEAGQRTARQWVVREGKGRHSCDEGRERDAPALPAAAP